MHAFYFKFLMQELRRYRAFFCFIKKMSTGSHNLMIPLFHMPLKFIFDDEVVLKKATNIFFVKCKELMNRKKVSE